MTENETTPSLHEVLARGIERGLRDVGADLTGCTPSMLTGHVIRELRAAGMHPAGKDAEIARLSALLRGMARRSSAYRRTRRRDFDKLMVKWLSAEDAGIALRARVEAAAGLLAEFVDDEPCQFDHHGGCQTHGFLEPNPGERCHVARTREWLSPRPTGEDAP